MLTTLFLLLTASVTGATAADVDAGRALYQAKCQACHGPTGDGQGPAARALPKKPRDMTDAAFWKAFTDDRLTQLIKTGKPGTAMRGFPMRDDQLADLIAFLHTFEPTT